MMKELGAEIYGTYYTQLMTEEEQTCPGPQGPPPDPLDYCDSVDYMETFWGGSSSEFCRFLGAKCAAENGDAHEHCKVKWINLYYTYTDVCAGGSLKDGSSNPRCGCEKLLMQEHGPSQYNDYFEAWGYTFFINHSGDSACPCATRTSGLRESMAEASSNSHGKHQVCKK